jgi:methionine synthase II (cobalamin-independent)
MSSQLISKLDSLRIDLVGSLLRPANLKAAFAKFAVGETSEAELKTRQDEAIRAVVAKQLERDLPIIVDGEFAAQVLWRALPSLPAWKNGKLA